MLHLQTPLSKAVQSLFERALPLLEGMRPGTLKIYVFGGCAMHILTNARGSADVDAELRASEQLLIEEIKTVLQAPEDYEENGLDLSVVFDQGFNNSLCPLHEDYDERAIALPGQENAPMQVFIANPFDLAISKLGRFTERDREDILTLIRELDLDLEKLDKLALEAIDYYPCDKATVISYLRIILDDAAEQR
ncbi:DUF6036 family nucleotidyltransferase [Pseudomonas sp. NPDC090592]|uniref:DUF6036 family nucleotidyltransferase n=1 Tax=Pseudomonas sp. NPDC090592 TaxID=3364480 RepID=UPI00383BB354